jgi:cytohesin
MKPTTWLRIPLLALFVVVTLPNFAGEIHDAAQAGDGETVERLLHGGTDINEQDKDKFTALHSAAYAGHLPVVEILLKNSAAPDLAIWNGRTALHLAAMEDHFSIVQALLDHGAQINPLDKEGVPPLGLAVAACRPAVAELLIQQGADVNRRFNDNVTLLHGLPYAPHADRHREIAELLIAAGADVNAETRNERNTPLSMAVMFGDYDTAELLLKAGADVDSANSYNDRPLHGAAITGQAKIVALLLAHGAQVEVADASGMTALHWAVGEGRKTKNGPSMMDFVTRRRGGTPLPHDYVATARELIEHGASIEKRDRKGRTASKIAKKRGDPKMIALLKGAVQP